MLDRPGQLEDEIGMILVERAIDHARALFADGEDAPTGDDLYTRAVRGVHATLTAHTEAVERADQAKRYAETDAFLARMKAGEEL